MLSVLVAAVPRGIPPGFTGALLLLALGMGVVFLVLTGLTLIMWVIGKIARDRAPASGPMAPQAPEAKEEVPPASAKAESPPVAAPEALSSSAVAAIAAATVLESAAVRIPSGGPLSDAELAALTTAVALDGAAGTTSAELAAIATAVACQTGGPSAGALIQVIHEAPQPGSGAWGAAAFAGQSGSGLPALRRG